MSASVESQPKGELDRAVAPRRWQERISARAALASGLATFLVGVLGFLDAARLPNWAVAILVTLGFGMSLLALPLPYSFRLRAGVLMGLSSLASVVAAAGPSTAQAPWLLAFMTAVSSTLLLGSRRAVALLLGIATTIVGAQSTIGVGFHAQLLVMAGTFAVCATFAVGWVDYAISRLRQTLDQRDDLLAFVREETEERITQLEKQQALERQLRQSQKMEALGTLAGGIAHDFNNLLLVIASGTQSAKDAPREELDEILVELREAANRGTGLTQQLLAFGRRRINERGALALNDEISKSLQLIRRLIPSSITLEFTPDPQVRSIEATPVDVDQVIMNLCINARDAMPQGGRVELSTELKREPGHLGSEAIIRIRDFGVGMTDEQKERVFEPFYTTKQTGQGTGLGLSVVHSIVLGHKGRMELDTSPGRGTEFRVFFPHIDEATGPLSVQDRLPRVNGGERILLVDDDPAVRKGIARVLKRAGYDVLVAEDGVQALEQYKQSDRPIDLVVTDAVMPNMGGRDLCEAVTHINPNQPCLICSGYDAGTLDEGFFLEPGREFLAKPFDNDQLLQRIDQLMTLQSMSLRPPPSSETQSFRGTQTPLSS